MFWLCFPGIFLYFAPSPRGSLLRLACSGFSSFVPGVGAPLWVFPRLVCSLALALKATSAHLLALARMMGVFGYSDVGAFLVLRADVHGPSSGG